MFGGSGKARRSGKVLTRSISAKGNKGRSYFIRVNTKSNRPFNRVKKEMLMKLQRLYQIKKSHCGCYLYWIPSKGYNDSYCSHDKIGSKSDGRVNVFC